MKHLEIIPTDKYALQFPSIYPSQDHIPEWFRKSPTRMSNTNSEVHREYWNSTTGTYKRCVPFFDAMTAGYVAVLTADIEVIKDNDGSSKILWRTKKNMVSHQEPSQLEGLPIPKGYSSFAFKFDNQFVLKTPKGTSLLFVHPSNRFDLPFITMNGLVDTDSFDLPINFPFFIRDDFVGIIEAGTPIAQIIPIERNSWKSKRLSYDPDRHKISLEKYVSRIKRAYKYFHWTKKEYR